MNHHEVVIQWRHHGVRVPGDHVGVTGCITAIDSIKIIKQRACERWKIRTGLHQGIGCWLWCLGILELAQRKQTKSWVLFLIKLLTIATWTWMPSYWTKRFARVQVKHLPHKSTGHEQHVSDAAHGDWVDCSESAIVSIASCARKRVNDPAALTGTDKQTALVHAKAVYGWAFKPKYPHALSTAVIPHANAAVSRRRVQDLLQVLKIIKNMR